MAHNQAAAEVSGPTSLAAGIACTVSSYRGAAALRAAAGRALTFQENTVAEAMRELAHEGLWQEFSGVAGIAALRDAKQRGETFEEPIVTVLTSTGLKDVPAIPGSLPAAVRPSLEDVIASLKSQ
jgi:threonine synthase